MSADVDTIREALLRATSPLEYADGRQHWVDEALAALDRLAAAEARAEALTPTSWLDLHGEAVERAEAAEAQRDTLAEELRLIASAPHNASLDYIRRAARAAVAPTEAPK